RGPGAAEDGAHPPGAQPLEPMSPAAHTDWSEVLRHTLARYDEPLLRRVAARLLKPRNQWPADELVARCAPTAGDVPVLDRRPPRVPRRRRGKGPGAGGAVLRAVAGLRRPRGPPGVRSPPGGDAGGRRGPRPGRLPRAGRGGRAGPGG